MSLYRASTRVGQPHGERGASAGPTLERDLASHRLHHAVHDPEPEAEARRGARAAALELLEHATLIRFGNARALVAHAHARSLRRPFDAHLDGAAASIFDRV